MNQLEIRCEGDLSLQKQLLEEKVVQSACSKIEELPERNVRRQLLATSLRLTESMSPRLHGMLKSCISRLRVEIEVETFVYNSPQLNAACIKPENNTLLLMFSSSILEKFNEEELLFVMGHELGHYLFSHHDIPIGYLTSGPDQVNARLALQLFAWSRYAEISADRAGGICCTDGDAAARALFKLASGLTTDLIEIKIDDFAAQADEMDLDRTDGRQSDLSADWFLTHPFTPLRVKALQGFFASELVTPGGASRSQLEIQCHNLMELMSPNYLDEKSETAETMRRVLFAAGLGLIRCSGGVKQDEIEAFDSLFGAGAYNEELDFEGLEKLLDQRIEDANNTVPQARKTQLLRDLCLLAKCDGRITQKERSYVNEVGSKLKISRTVIDHCFHCDCQLD